MSLLNMIFGRLHRSRTRCYRLSAGPPEAEFYKESEQLPIINESIPVVRESEATVVYVPCIGFTPQSAALTFLIILTLILFLQPTIC